MSPPAVPVTPSAPVEDERRAELEGEPPLVETPVAAPAPTPGKSRLTPGVQLGLTALLVAVAAAISGVTVYLITRNDNPPAAPQAADPNAVHPLEAIVPAPVWDTCKTQATPRPGAVETAVCLPPKGSTTFTPDRLEISTFATGAAVQAVYEAVRRAHHLPRDKGKCNGLSWGGEGPWSHNPAAPGLPPKLAGERLCYFDGNDAVIVWTHRKFGQPTHTDILAIAREGGSDHPGLFGWWRYWHHRIGKAVA
jgi:hypothetical protein